VTSRDYLVQCAMSTQLDQYAGRHPQYECYDSEDTKKPSSRIVYIICSTQVFKQFCGENNIGLGSPIEDNWGRSRDIW